MTKDQRNQLALQFWKVRNREDASYVLKQCSYGFILVGIINILVGFFIGWVAILDGVIYSVLGVLLLLLKSRIVSILLLIITGVGVVITFLNAVGVTSGGSNFILAIIIFYISVASTYAAFRYYKSG